MSRSNRRRGHGSDDEEEDRSEAPKRYRRAEAEIEEQLADLIVRIGEKTEKTSAAITQCLEEVFAKLESELTDHKNKIKEILLECAAELPEKLSIFTTLVGLLNSKNYSFGGEVVEGLGHNLLQNLREGKFDKALHLVAFISNLVNCRVISCQSMVTLLDNFMAVTVEPGIPQVRSDWYVYAVLCSLPYIGKELSEKHETVLEQLLEAVVSYLNKREKLHVPLLRVWSASKPHPQEEYLDCLWAQIDKLRTDSWDEHHVARYYAAFESVIGEALQHQLPSFIPPPHIDTSAYPSPRVVYRMFDYTDCPEDGPVLPGTYSIERFLIEQDLNWIIRTHHFERKTCAAALVSYSQRGKVPLNYMILEVIFGQLFHLPQPPYLQLFYGSLLIELCKLQPNSMPQVLAQAAEMLYQRIDTMQIMCIDRFVDWFSYHLSNFQFRWSWDDWADCLSLDSFHPKQLFVREVLTKCMRLSYHQRVIDIMPPKFASLLPAKPEPNFKYSKDESLPGTSIAQELARMIRNKCTPEEALAMLENCPKTGNDKCNPLKIEVLFLTLLHLGSKSFSHSFAALAKYHVALKSLTERDPDALVDAGDDESGPIDPQLVLLESLYELWNSHPQMLVVIVDKLLKMQIVECEAIVKFVFSDQLKEDFRRTYVWEILFSATSKLSRHVDKLRKDIEAKKVKQEDEPMGDGEVKKEDSSEEVEKPNNGRSAEMLEAKLVGAEEVQRTMFLTLFQKFIVLLTEYLLRCETEGINYDTDYYRYALGRMKQSFLIHTNELEKHVGDLDQHLFSNEFDPHLLEVFQQFCALRR